ncbi:hypothetical protein Dimus_023401 [Dionaea muscipula]
MGENRGCAQTIADQTQRARDWEGEEVRKMSSEEGKADAQLFNLLSTLLHEVEALTNQEEVELRTKIEALGLEVSKVPSEPPKHLDEMEIARELDKLSTKLDDVDEMISSAMAEDPQVKSLLSSTADVWMPVITATSDERRKFSALVGDDKPQADGYQSS